MLLYNELSSRQVVFTVCMLVIWSIEKKLEEHAKDDKPDAHPNDRRNRIISERLDKAGNILVLLVIVSNVFITGFGVEPHVAGIETTGTGNGGNNAGHT